MLGHLLIKKKNSFKLVFSFLYLILDWGGVYAGPIGLAKALRWFQTDQVRFLRLCKRHRCFQITRGKFILRKIREPRDTVLRIPTSVCLRCIAFFDQNQILMHDYHTSVRHYVPATCLQHICLPAGKSWSAPPLLLCYYVIMRLLKRGEMVLWSFSWSHLVYSRPNSLLKESHANLTAVVELEFTRAALAVLPQSARKTTILLTIL